MSKVYLIRFSSKSSGGNLLLGKYGDTNFLTSKVIEITILNANNRFWPNVFLSLYQLFKLVILIRFQSKIIVYSDPILSFLDLCIPKKKIIRLIQSKDEDLYSNHPRLSVSIQKLLKSYIIFALKFGKSIKLVHTPRLKTYVEKYDHSVEQITIPLPIFSVAQVKGCEDYISVVMSNPLLKNIELLIDIANDFPSEVFHVITPYDLDNMPSNVLLKHFLERHELLYHIKNSKCHLSVSTKESIGLPVFEAMALDVPSVFLLNDGNSQFLEPGLLSFEHYNKESFASILETFKHVSFKKNIIKKQRLVINKYFDVNVESTNDIN